MPELLRFIILLIIALLVLFSFVQCRTILTESMGRPKRSLDVMCMFRKSRFCDYVRAIQQNTNEQAGDEQDLWKRGVSRFYSNW